MWWEKVQCLWFQSWHYWTEIIQDKPQWADAMLWWRNQSPVHHFSGYFKYTSSQRHHQMFARNVGSVYSYGTNSWHTIPYTSKLTWVSISHRNKLLCLLQAGRSHIVICNDLWKEVCMSDVSSECPGRQWCNSNCFCSSISIQGRNLDTIHHKLNLVSKSDDINQKAVLLISQLVDSNTSTFMPNTIDMFLISVHSAARQAPWIFSTLDRCHSISGLCKTIKYYSLPHCFLSESKC